jgi:hypothetical protein
MTLLHAYFTLVCSFIFGFVFALVFERAEVPKILIKIWTYFWCVTPLVVITYALAKVLILAVLQIVF